MRKKVGKNMNAKKDEHGIVRKTIVTIPETAVPEARTRKIGPQL